jgi:hypothetical protein
MNPTTRRQTRQHTKTKHQTQTDKRNSTQQHQIIETIMASASSQITKGAGESRRLPNHKGCQCHIITKSEAEQSHRICNQKGVLDIAYLTIHVDAGAMAFTQRTN